MVTFTNACFSNSLFPATSEIRWIKWIRLYFIERNFFKDIHWLMYSSRDPSQLPFQCLCINPLLISDIRILTNSTHQDLIIRKFVRRLTIQLTIRYMSAYKFEWVWFLVFYLLIDLTTRTVDRLYGHDLRSCMATLVTSNIELYNTTYVPFVNIILQRSLSLTSFRTFVDMNLQTRLRTCSNFNQAWSDPLLRSMSLQWSQTHVVTTYV